MAGLTCYTAEGPGVCCNSACSGTCETCKPATPGVLGTCTAIAAGADGSEGRVRRDAPAPAAAERPLRGKQHRRQRHRNSPLPVLRRCRAARARLPKSFLHDSATPAAQHRKSRPRHAPAQGSFPAAATESAGTTTSLRRRPVRHLVGQSTPTASRRSSARCRPGCAASSRRRVRPAWRTPTAPPTCAPAESVARALVPPATSATPPVFAPWVRAPARIPRARQTARPAATATPARRPTLVRLAPAPALVRSSAPRRDLPRRAELQPRQRHLL